jgi:excisionase family DNA binding protein
MTSAEVARRAGVTPATVRWWETSGKLPAERTESGVRLFSREDVDRFLADRETAETGRAS